MNFRTRHDAIPFHQLTSLFWLLAAATTVVAAQAARPLQSGDVVAGELADGRQDVFQITLNAGQYLRVTVEQRGVNVTAQLSGPDGNRIGEFDDEVTTGGQEVVEYAALTAGVYRLTLLPAQRQAPPGRYELRVAELRAATETEHKLQAARDRSPDRIGRTHLPAAVNVRLTMPRPCAIGLDTNYVPPNPTGGSRWDSSSLWHQLGRQSGQHAGSFCPPA